MDKLLLIMIGFVILFILAFAVAEHHYVPIFSKIICNSRQLNISLGNEIC